jgi:hypothetical protein
MWIGLRKEFKLNVKSPASALRLLNILLRKLPGKVFETFQIFSDTTADYAGFRLWGTAGCQPAVFGSLPTTRSRSEAQVTHLLSRRGVVGPIMYYQRIGCSVCDKHEYKFQVFSPIQCETVELGVSD